MKTLSNNATITDKDGYIESRGATVIAHEETSTRCATIQINCTEHRADACEITETKIKHKLAGWEVTL